MEKELKDYLIPVLFIPVLIFTNCAVISTTGNEFGNKNSLKKVLIASAKNRSRDPVFSKVIKTLKKDGCYILLSNQKNLTNSKAKKFGAIIVVNDVQKGQKNHGIKVFLDEREQKKIILFNAVGKEYWKSADKSDNSGKIANTIVKKVRTVFKVRNK